ncbi:MAG: zinc ribbon domain-containing protein [Anaerolineae bacterium]
MLLLFLVVPIVLIGLLAGGGYALWRGVGSRESIVPEPQRYTVSPKRCSTCGQSLQDDWVLCPYCGTEIV